MKSKDNLSIINEIKKCLEEIDLPVIEERNEHDMMVLITELVEGPFSLFLSTCYLPCNQTIQLYATLTRIFSTEKLNELYSMINLINLEMVNIGGLCVDQDSGMPKLSSYIWISDQGLNPEQLKMTIIVLIQQVYQFVRQIAIAQHMNLSPEEMLERFKSDVEKMSKKTTHH